MPYGNELAENKSILNSEYLGFKNTQSPPNNFGLFIYTNLIEVEPHYLQFYIQNNKSPIM